jgi:uncharacterized protein (DUF58 family)
VLSAELASRIQGLHFKTKHLVTDLFAGLYGSAFKGSGIEFSEVRPYQPGDDTRAIDWKVSARFGRPFVKLFHEERELTVMLLLDVSGSLLFGTRMRLKRDLMAELAGMLAFLAIKTNDRIGAILFTSKVEKYVPPKKGAAHVWRLIKEVYAYDPQERGTDIGVALSYLNRVQHHHAVVFVISDFLCRDFTQALKASAKRHDLTLLRAYDPAEQALPKVGWMSLADSETGETLVVHTGNRTLRGKWSVSRQRFARELLELSRKTGIDLAEVSTEGDLVEPLMRLFREKRSRR